MSSGVRKLVGGLAIVVFVAVYAVLAIVIADRLPDSQFVRLVYFAVVGVAWGIPLLPLLTWIQRDR